VDKGRGRMGRRTKKNKKRARRGKGRPKRPLSIPILQNAEEGTKKIGEILEDKNPGGGGGVSDGRPFVREGAEKKEMWGNCGKGGEYQSLVVSAEVGG